MKPSKTQKELKEMPYPPQYKSSYEEQEILLHQQSKCPNFTNFFRTPKINNSNLPNEKQRT